MLKLLVNGSPRELDVEPDTPLLWALRDALELQGTRFGCGIGSCGACTVLMDGRAIRSCVTPVSALTEATAITTIEGLSGDGMSHPVQRAWLDEKVPQCGYCQSGQILSAVSLLNTTPDPDDQQINAAMSGNLCRCGTYDRIRRAIKRAARAGDSA